MPAFTAIGLAIGASAAAAAATGAAVVGAAAAAAGTGYAVHAGEQGRKAQNAAMDQQRAAQAEATRAAETQAERSQQAINAANRKSPDMSSIMGAAASQASGGPSGTMLTGPGGVNPQDLALGRNTLLGG